MPDSELPADMLSTEKEVSRSESAQIQVHGIEDASRLEVVVVQSRTRRNRQQ